jgi:hypothetical protein
LQDGFPKSRASEKGGHAMWGAIPELTPDTCMAMFGEEFNTAILTPKCNHKAFFISTTVSYETGDVAGLVPCLIPVLEKLKQEDQEFEKKAKHSKNA